MHSHARLLRETALLLRQGVFWLPAPWCGILPIKIQWMQRVLAGYSGASATEFHRLPFPVSGLSKSEEIYTDRFVKVNELMSVTAFMSYDRLPFYFIRRRLMAMTSIPAARPKRLSCPFP